MLWSKAPLTSRCKLNSQYSLLKTGNHFFFLACFLPLEFRTPCFLFLPFFHSLLCSLPFSLTSGCCSTFGCVPFSVPTLTPQGHLTSCMTLNALYAGDTPNVYLQPRSFSWTSDLYSHLPTWNLYLDINRCLKLLTSKFKPLISPRLPFLPPTSPVLLTSESNSPTLLVSQTKIKE